jgi:hypothetical protein
MFLLILFLSYLLGCASTIAVLLYLYTRYALQSTVNINDQQQQQQQQQQEQYGTFQPLPEVCVEDSSSVCLFVDFDCLSRMNVQRILLSTQSTIFFNFSFKN